MSAADQHKHELFWGRYGSAAGWLEALARGAECDDDPQTAIYARYAARELVPTEPNDELVSALTRCHITRVDERRRATARFLWGKYMKIIKKSYPV